MTRPLNDSPYLYGLHDPGGEQLMAQAGTKGWILFTEELGSDPNDRRGSRLLALGERRLRDHGAPEQRVRTQRHDPALEPLP